MSDDGRFGLAPARVRPRKPRRLNAYQAQRIRFGILAARHILERDRMTPDQVEYLERCELHGWIVGDAGTLKAFDQECLRIELAAVRVAAFRPGDLVHIMLRPNDVCAEFHNRHGVITYGPDKEGGWIVSSAPGSLRCVADELTMITPREKRNA